MKKKVVEKVNLDIWSLIPSENTKIDVTLGGHSFQINDWGLALTNETHREVETFQSYYGKETIHPFSRHVTLLAKWNLERSN